MKKYLTKEPVGGSDGFWYDISYGGYIKPHELLVDKDKADKLQAAIDLLLEWEQELMEDDMLNEM